MISTVQGANCGPRAHWPRAWPGWPRGEHCVLFAVSAAMHSQAANNNNFITTNIPPLSVCSQTAGLSNFSTEASLDKLCSAAVQQAAEQASRSLLLTRLTRISRAYSVPCRSVFWFPPSSGILATGSLSHGDKRYALRRECANSATSAHRSLT